MPHLEHTPSVLRQPAAMRKSLSFLLFFVHLMVVNCLNPFMYKVFVEPRLESGAIVLSGEVEIDVENRGTYNVPVLKKNFNLKRVEATENGVDVTRPQRQRPNDKVYQLRLVKRSGTFRLKTVFERLGQDLPELGYRAYRAKGQNSTEVARSLAILRFGSGEERFPFPIVEGTNVSKPVDIKINLKLSSSVTLLVDQDSIYMYNSTEKSADDQHTTAVLSVLRPSPLSELLVVLLGPWFSSLASTKPTSVRFWGPKTASASLYFASSRQELLEAALHRLLFRAPLAVRKVDVVAAPVVRILGGPGLSSTLLLVPDSTLAVDAATSGPSAARDALLAMARYALISSLPLPTTTTEEDAFLLFAQYAVGHLVDAEHRLEQFFLVDVARHSLEKDVKSYTTNPCLKIQQESGRTSSARGAAILRMLSSARDEEAFWANVINFSRAGNTNTTLGSALLSSMASEWVSRRGYPLITVTRNYVDGTALVEQRPFFGEENFQWTVPLEYKSSISLSKLETFQLKNKPGPQNMAGLGRGSFHFIMFNPRGNGYYRVHYDSKNWALLRRQLSETNLRVLLSPEERAVLVDDALSLARAKVLNYSDALDLASYLRDEDDALPWKAAIRQFAFLDAALSQAPETTRDMFRSFLEELVSRQLNALKDAEENGEDLTEGQKLLKNTILPWTCELGLPSCSDVVYMEKDSSARSAWLCSQVREKTSDAIWQDFLGAETSDRKLYVEALKCASNADIVERFLSEAVQGGIEFSPEHVVTVVANNPNAARALARVVTKAHRKTSWLPVVVQEIFHSVSKPSDFAIMRNNLDLCGAAEGRGKIWDPSNERVSWSAKFLVEVTQWLERRYRENKPTS